jgi:hypothetical protein
MNTKTNCPIVIVYIWFPAGYNDRNDERYSTVLMNSMESTFMTIKEWQKLVGHASLFVRNTNGDQCYLSFWPEPNKKSDAAGIVRSFFPGMSGKFVKSLSQDKKGMAGKDIFSDCDNDDDDDDYMEKKIFNNNISSKTLDTLAEGLKLDKKEGEPDRIIYLPFLLSSNVYNKATKLKSVENSYHIFSNNCSTMVFLALKSGVKGGDIIKDFKSLYLRLRDVTLYSASILFIYKICINSFKNTSPLNYNNFLMTQRHSSSDIKISMISSIFALPELIQVKTPKSVFEYAKRLEKLSSQIENGLERKLIGKILEIKESLFGEFNTIKTRLNTVKSSLSSSYNIDNIYKVNNKYTLNKTDRKIEKENSSTTTSVKRVRNFSKLLYISIIMAFCVQFFYLHKWQFLFFKSYEYAFATSFFLFACGVSRTAQIWENSWVGFGIFLTTIGGFTWKYKWILPIFKTYEIPLFIGVCMVLYGLIPQLLGLIFIIPGAFLLFQELDLMFTKGLAAIHYTNLFASIILIFLSAKMYNRYENMKTRGVFRRKTPK